MVCLQVLKGLEIAATPALHQAPIYLSWEQVHCFTYWTAQRATFMLQLFGSLSMRAHDEGYYAGMCNSSLPIVARHDGAIMIGAGSTSGVSYIAERIYVHGCCTPSIGQIIPELKGADYSIVALSGVCLSFTKLWARLELKLARFDFENY